MSHTERNPSLPKRFSFSSAETFESCPRKWHAKYVKKILDPAGPEAAAGSFVHSVLEEIMGKHRRERTLLSARAAAKAAWETFAPNFAELQAADPDRVTEIRRKAWGDITRAFAAEDLGEVEVVGLETKLDVDMDGVPMVGFVDRIDRDWLGGVVVNDYKTGKIPAPRYKLPKERQIRLYAKGYEISTGEVPTSGRILWIGGAKKPKVWDVDVGPKHVEETVNWFRWLWESLDAAFDTDVFEEKPGPLCGWCPDLADCQSGHTAVLARMGEGKTVGPGEGVMVELGLAKISA